MVRSQTKKRPASRDLSSERERSVSAARHGESPRRASSSSQLPAHPLGWGHAEQLHSKSVAGSASSQEFVAGAGANPPSPGQAGANTAAEAGGAQEQPRHSTGEADENRTGGSAPPRGDVKPEPGTSAAQVAAEAAARMEDSVPAPPLASAPAAAAPAAAPAEASAGAEPAAAEAAFTFAAPPAREGSQCAPADAAKPGRQAWPRTAVAAPGAGDGASAPSSDAQAAWHEVVWAACCMAEARVKEGEMTVDHVLGAPPPPPSMPCSGMRAPFFS